jgi:uncharacterized protein YebE (UPF0316 family)
MAFGIHEIILIALIFCARIVDVSIGTVRLIFVSKGLKFLAPILGFFEIFVWIVVVSKVMAGATQTIFYVAYAAGFAAGTYVGMKLEDRLSIGKVIIRIITQRNSDDLIQALKDSHHSITLVDAQGKKEDVKIILSIVEKKELKKITEIIYKYNPKAIYSIEDVRYANTTNPNLPPKKKFFGMMRKSK